MLRNPDWEVVKHTLQSVPPEHYMHNWFNQDVASGGALSWQRWEKHDEVLFFLKETPRELNVLDYGCGPGMMDFTLADKDYNVYGYDIDEHVITMANLIRSVQDPIIKDRLVFKTSLPPAEMYFEVCWMSHTLEHIPMEEWPFIFKKLRNQVLLFEIAVPIGHGYDNGDGSHVNFWETLESLTSALSASGLTIRATATDETAWVYRVRGTME